MPIHFASAGQRLHTGNIKWDLQGPIPLGIADMDIATPPCIRQAMQERLDHPFYGYTYMTNGVRNAICHYLQTQHSISTDPAWLHALPGCVPAFTLVTRAICNQPQHAVFVGTPAYPPMLHVHEDAGCTLVTYPHHEVNGRWEMDWDAMEQAVTPPHTPLPALQPPQPARAQLERGRTPARCRLLRTAQPHPLLRRNPLRPHP